MILSGELPPETKLPSERELSKQLDISRMTVRRAITELVNEGMLNAGMVRALMCQDQKLHTMPVNY